MKKSILLLVLFFVSILGNAQSFFDKYESQDNVSSVIVNKKMFELMSKVKMESKEDLAYLSLIKKLESLKVYKTTSTKTTADMRITVEKYLATANLKELSRANNSGVNSKVYVKPSAGSNNVSELLLFIEGDGGKTSETVLMTLLGDFTVNEISLLTKRMNLPGGEVINSASSR